jgi:hypothetical protein
VVSFVSAASVLAVVSAEAAAAADSAATGASSSAPHANMPSIMTSAITIQSTFFILIFSISSL